MTNKTFSKLLLACICIILAGCSAPVAIYKATATSEPTPPDLYTSFTSLHQEFSQITPMGKVISPIEVTADGKKCQTVMNARYCLDDNTTDAAKRITLAPVGLDLVKMLPAEISKKANAPHELDQNFIKLANSLRLSTIGKCLTDPILDALNKRIVQYCTNLGFAYSIDSADKSPYLLAYGAMSCPGCGVRLQGASIISGVEILGLSNLERFSNGLRAFDGIISKPSMVNGNLVQVHNGVVFTGKSTLPIVREVGKFLLIATTPIAKPKDKVAGFEFYEVGNGLGFLVPSPFDLYIVNRGGLATSGMPLTEYQRHPDLLIDYQCFENFCLYFDRKTNAVAFYPLGKSYLKEHKIPEAPMFSPQGIVMTISKRYPILDLDKQQTIVLLVQEKASLQPVPNIEAIVTLMMSNGVMKDYPLPPTDKNGKSQLTLPLIEKPTKQQAIPYVVCLDLRLDDPNRVFCSTDTFMFSLVD